VAALAVKGIVARLLSRPELLELGHRTTVRRHRTLRATLDWSYDLLSDVERIAFRRLALFVGHFTLEAAQGVAGDPGSDTPDIVDAIACLFEKSLLETLLDRGEPQYRFLHKTRVYALGKLEEHAEADLISLRHAQYVAEQLESERTTNLALPKAKRFTIYSGQLSIVCATLEWSSGRRAMTRSRRNLQRPQCRCLRSCDY
jgi:predicted ATPase